MTKYQITEFKRDLFEVKMNRFSNRASKLEIDFGYKLVSSSKASYIQDGRTYWYTVYTYTVWGESPSIHGYTFLAKIEPFEGSNLIHSHNTDFDFTYYRNAELSCEHCHINRFRTFYYLIQNDADKTVKMVGRNCLANYLELPNADDIAEFYGGLFFDDSSEEENQEDHFRHGINWIEIKAFLPVVMYSIKSRGWVSSQGEGMSTKDHSLDLWINPKDENNHRIEIPEDYKNQCVKIIETVKSELSKKSKLSEYENTILTLLENDYMKINHAGYIASIIPLYNRMLETKIQAENHPSNFIGTIGEKITNVSAIVSYTNELENQWGITYLYNFLSGDNKLSYFSSRNLFLETGDKIIINVATVKDHSVYNGKNQTVITRGKITKIE